MSNSNHYPQGLWAVLDGPKLAEAAQSYAHEAHDSIKQLRKYTCDPYWVHTDSVERRYASYFPNDYIGRAASHLHDTPEDVTKFNPRYSLADIIDVFGREVAKVVDELTEVYTSEAYPKWNRQQRKRLEVERLALVSSRAQSIKLCDLIDNTSSIVEHDPKFATTYLREKEELLAVLVHVDTNLRREAIHSLRDSLARLSG